MKEKDHFEALDRMFRSANFHKHFPPFSFHLERGYCRIESSVDDRYHHAAEAMHGAFYFKLLDEAGYFAAMSEEQEKFLLTRNLNIRFLRPVESGELIAIGRLKHFDGKIYYAEAELLHKGKQIASAELELARGPVSLNEVEAYRSEKD